MRGLLSTIWSTKGLARWILLTGFVVTVIFVVFALFAPWIAPFDYNQTRDAAGVKFPKLDPPSGEHWLGTNDQFYDILSRVIWGARTAIEVVFCRWSSRPSSGSRSGSSPVSPAAGLDRFLVFIMDAIYALPSLLLAIVFAFLLTGLLGGGIVAAALSLTVIYIPQYFRVVRNTTVSTRETTYVEAARAIGAPPSVIIRKYLFGNVVQSVPVIGTLNAADAIGTLAGPRFPRAWGSSPTRPPSGATT